jgi:hypothetical protein
LQLCATTANDDDKPRDARVHALLRALAVRCVGMHALFALAAARLVSLRHVCRCRASDDLVQLAERLRASLAIDDVSDGAARRAAWLPVVKPAATPSTSTSTSSATSTTTSTTSPSSDESAQMPAQPSPHVALLLQCVVAAAQRAGAHTMPRVAVSDDVDLTRTDVALGEIAGALCAAAGARSVRMERCDRVR